jgi:hypothetical protein
MADALGVLGIVVFAYVAAVALYEAWHGRLLSWRALSAPFSRKAE